MAKDKGAEKAEKPAQGFGRRFLSTFVQMDEPEPDPAEELAPAPSGARMGSGRRLDAQTYVGDFEPKEPFPELPRRPRLNPTEMSLEDVYAGAGVAAGPAGKVLKILTGLQALPPEQRLAAVRALASADGTWTEQDALRDATARIQAIDGYLSLLESEKGAAVAAAGDGFAATRADREAEIGEIVVQIQALSERREALVSADREEAQRELQAQREIQASFTGAVERAKAATGEWRRFLAFFGVK